MTAAQTDTVDGGFSLYIHWPFCAAKCPYCDFNSHVRESLDEDRWARAFLADLRAQAAMLETRPRLDSLFFGGGTPSLMAPETVGALIDEAARLFPFADDIEITLEANPTSSERAKFEDLRKAGVGRVSLGIQSLHDDALRFLGRRHSAAEALKALDAARAVFPRFSFDLIYARPGQSAADWEAELRRALALVGDHLSLYQLTFEPGTGFTQRRDAGDIKETDEDTAADLFELTQALTAEAGLHAYEISNHARPGGESRHNLIYWRGGGWLGVGPGAHGRLPFGHRRRATETHRQPESWLTAAETAGHGLCKSDEVSARDQATERLLMGLRLAEGVSRAGLDSLDPRLIDETALADLRTQGFLDATPTHLRATAKGRAVLNYLLAELIADGG